MSNLNDSILINPSDEHTKALLSKLAYENLSTGFNFSNLDNSFSIAEKNYLKENFEVLSVSDSNDSGFQGCFLKNTKTNEIIYAIRGTDDLLETDADDNLNITDSGIAYKQFIDAYNYYIKTVTATGDTGKLLKYGNQQPAEGTAYIDTGDGHYIYFEDFTGTGNGYSNVSITGHSLGGHLAGLIGIITGNQTTIFNAPGYNDLPNLEFSYISEDGTTENIISMVSGIISKLFNKDITSQSNITHIYNDNGWEIAANLGNNWTNSTPIYCLQEESSVHAINEICTAYYAYETIKDITNGAESFNDDKMGTSFNETFENVYKAYCLQFNLPYQTLDYSNYTFIQTLVSSIQIWSETQKANGGVIKVDSFNHSTSPQMTGTGGADIFYTGGGNDTVDAGAGNDIVYGIDLNGDTAAAASSTKTINLGTGDDEYYGSNAKDNINCGIGRDYIDAGSGENYIDLGADNDKDTVIINNNASGVDTIANITQYDHISCVGGFNLSSLQQVGNDMIIYGNNGNKIVFKDVAETESMPILEQEDNTLLYWKNGAYTEIEANPYAFENPSEEQICALLSKLAYENLSAGFNFNNLDKNKYTVAEIAYLKENFSVNEAKRNPASGFYGYVIENTKTGNFYYSIRGTDKLPGEAGAKDWGISTYGMAIDQFIEAYNFYVEALTPSGITGYKIITANERPEDVNTCILDTGTGKCYYLQSVTGTNSDITSSAAVTLTGTSLGGHLAGLLSAFIGKESIIFNAPQYNTSSNKKFNWIEDGHLYTSNRSTYSAFSNLLENVREPSSVKHIYNDTYFENNKAWTKQEAFANISDYTYAMQALDQINSSYYVYNTIKGIINDQDILDPDNDVDLKAAFDAVYHAYCLYGNKNLETLSYDNTLKNKEYADKIAIWRQQNIDSNIIIDVLPNDSWSDVTNGTEGNDLSFQKRRTNLINTEAGNDTVYAVGLDGTSSQSINVNLGAGSDIFYGSAGNDNINGGEDKDAATDKNIIYLGGGNDIYNGGDGIDIVDGGSGATGEIDATVYNGLKELMTDSDNNTNTIELGGGNDIYTGSNGIDDVNAGDGDDIIWSAGGNDEITTGNGNDIIYTGLGDDSVTVNAQSENDTSIVFLGAGSDELQNNSGNSTKIIDGGSGSIYTNLGGNAKYFENITQDMQIDGETDVNTINLRYGNNFYIGTKGIDKVTSKNSNNNQITYAWLGAGSDSYKGDRGVDIVDGGTGNIGVLAGALPDVQINSAVMNDKSSDINTIELGAGNDIYYCSSGTDIVSGGSGEDTFYWYADGSFDTITETTFGSEHNHIILGSGVSKDDLIAEYVADKKINLYTGADKQEGFSYEGRFQYTDLSFADNPNENFIIDQMGLTFDQKDTAETIKGTSGNDTIRGNGGDDVINGGKGNDTYVWNLGDGLDTLTDTSGESSISFGTGISFSDLSFSQSNRDLIINVKGDNTQGIIIKNYLSSGGSISTLWKNLIIADEQKTYDIPTMDMEINCPNNGSDNIIGGTNGNNIINSGSGNDTVYLGTGSNTFVWNLGDGLDTINFRSLTNGENGTIKFGPGITADDLDFYYSSGLKIVVKGDETQGIILTGFTGNGNKDPITTNYDKRLDRITFDDGSELFLNEIKVHSSTGKGTDFNDIIYNDSATETVFGGAGNDDMFGGDLNDRFNGDEGDDHFWGNGGDDILSGFDDDDSYYWNLGDGLDTIIDNGLPKQGDKIIFGEGITFNDLRFSSSHEKVPGLKITVKDDPTQGIFINGQMVSGKFINPIESMGIEFLEFADGTVINLKEIGLEIFSDENTNIQGGKADDILHAKDNITMFGEGGNDKYIYNPDSGNCQISDADGNNDTLVFGSGITINDLTFEEDGIDLQINFENGNTISIENYYNTTSGHQGKIESLEFADGSQISTDAALQLIQAMNSFGTDTSSTMDVLSNPTENVSDMCNLAAGSDLIKKAI